MRHEVDGMLDEERKRRAPIGPGEEDSGDRLLPGGGMMWGEGEGRSGQGVTKVTGGVN